MKVFRIFHRLERREQRMFHSFIQTELFNQRKDVIQLLDFMLKNQQQRPVPEVSWKKIYPNKPFSVAKWHLLTSRLYKLLEEFLAIGQLRKNSMAKSFYLARAYRNLGEEKYFNKTIASYQDQLQQQDLRDISYLQQMHDLTYEKYDYISSVNRKEKSNLQEVSNYLDTYFMASKLRQACYALSRAIIQQEEYQIHFMEDIIRLIEAEPDFLKVPAIAIYYYCYRSISEKDNEIYFIQLRKNINQFKDQFTPAEMRDIYTIAINYSIRRLNTGAAHYIRETFELYLLSLEQGFLIENGFMQDSTYINLVSLACKLEKFDWAKKFIEEHRASLSLNSQTPLYHYSLGKLFYEQGLPDQSLPHLVLVDAKASFIFLGARILQLKIYYEQQAFDPLESLLESLRVYLQRSKNLAYRKAHYANIIAFTKQLLSLSTMTKEEKLAFRKRVIEAEVLGEKDWILKAIG